MQSMITQWQAELDRVHTPNLKYLDRILSIDFSNNRLHKTKYLALALYVEPNSEDLTPKAFLS